MEPRRKGRPPVVPRREDYSSGDEEETGDTIAELGTVHAPLRKSANYTPIPWTDFFNHREIALDHIPIYYSGTEGPIFLCLHGAGHSALSFACVAEEARAYPYRVAAFDCRGHGENTQPGEEDMSEGVLVEDTIAILRYIREKFPGQAVVLVGHSMGGAIAAKSAYRAQELGEDVAGVIVLDVVEGSAIDALPFMEGIVRQRPVQFNSIEQAVSWSVQTNYIRNLRSARVSIPPQLQQNSEGKYVWRANLIGTKDFWEGWFRGLTQKFLGCHCIKQVIVAGSDRIDRDMMIAQMQGKYKHTILADVGHVVHEDAPKILAKEFEAYLSRFRIG